MRDVDSALLPYFFKKYATVSTGFVLYLDEESGVPTHKYTDRHPLPVSSGGYESLGLKRSTIKTDDGTVLNEVEIGLDNTSLEFKQLVMSGEFNNKRCAITLIFWSDSGAYIDDFTIYSGFMDSPKGDDNWITLTITPFTVFDRTYPRRIYQTGCNWTFAKQGDNTCSLIIGDYDVDTTVSSLSNGITISCSHGKAVNYFTPGFVEITSGDYDGETRPILSNDASSVTVRIPFGHNIAQSTSIKLQKLCAKNIVTCEDDFNNINNYGGFPHVPKQPII